MKYCVVALMLFSGMICGSLDILKLQYQLEEIVESGEQPGAVSVPLAADITSSAVQTLVHLMEGVKNYADWQNAKEERLKQLSNLGFQDEQAVIEAKSYQGLTDSDLQALQGALNSMRERVARSLWTDICDTAEEPNDRKREREYRAFVLKTDPINVTLQAAYQRMYTLYTEDLSYYSYGISTDFFMKTLNPALERYVMRFRYGIWLLLKRFSEIYGMKLGGKDAWSSGPYTKIWNEIFKRVWMDFFSRCTLPACGIIRYISRNFNVNFEVVNIVGDQMTFGLKRLVRILENSPELNSFYGGISLADNSNLKQFILNTIELLEGDFLQYLTVNKKPKEKENRIATINEADRKLMVSAEALRESLYKNFHEFVDQEVRVPTTQDASWQEKVYNNTQIWIEKALHEWVQSTIQIMQKTLESKQKETEKDIIALQSNCEAFKIHIGNLYGLSKIFGGNIVTFLAAPAVLYGMSLDEKRVQSLRQLMNQEFAQLYSSLYVLRGSLAIRRCALLIQSCGGCISLVRTRENKVYWEKTEGSKQLASDEVNELRNETAQKTRKCISDLVSSMVRILQEAETFGALPPEFSDMWIKAWGKLLDNTIKVIPYVEARYFLGIGFGEIPSWHKKSNPLIDQLIDDFYLQLFKHINRGISGKLEAERKKLVAKEGELQDAWAATCKKRVSNWMEDLMGGLNSWIYGLDLQPGQKSQFMSNIKNLSDTPGRKAYVDRIARLYRDVIEDVKSTYQALKSKYSCLDGSLDKIIGTYQQRAEKAFKDLGDQFMKSK